MRTNEMKQSIKARLLLTYVECTCAFSVFAFNVHDQRRRMSAPWASLSRPNRLRFLSPFDLHAFDRKHVAQVQRVFFSFTRTPAGSKRRTRNNASRIYRFYISLTSYVSYRYVHTYVVWPKEGHARRSTLRNRCTDLFYDSNEKSRHIHFCQWELFDFDDSRIRCRRLDSVATFSYTYNPAARP